METFNEQPNPTKKLKKLFYFANGILVGGLILGIVAGILVGGQSGAPVMFYIWALVALISFILYVLYFIELFKRKKELNKKDRIMFWIAFLLMTVLGTLLVNLLSFMLPSIGIIRYLIPGILIGRDIFYTGLFLVLAASLVYMYLRPTKMDNINTTV